METTKETGQRRLRGEEARAHYSQLLDEQEASGLSVRTFASKRGLAAPTLYMWRRRLGRSSGRQGRDRREGSQGLVAVDLVEQQRSGSKGYELRMADGRRLRIPSDYDPIELSTLLSLLNC